LEVETESVATLDHQQVIEYALHPDADDQLSDAERRAMSEHLATCAECREKLASEATLKMEIQAVSTAKTPIDLRDRILAALDEVDSASEPRVRYLRHPVVWIASAALAASLILVIFNLRVSEPSNPAFDTAIQSFANSERSFSANAKSPDEVAVAFIDQFGVPMAWDFSPMGLTLAGARIERAADGSAIGYGLYRGARGSLLCMMYRDDQFRFPAGGEVVKGIHIYQYRGFSIAATNKYSVFCIMVTRMSTGELAQTFSRLPA
jgi:hypothetical protein